MNRQGTKQYKVLSHGEAETAGSTRQDFALAVLLGLSRVPKRLPSRFLYDDEGTRLFQQITELDAYYPTQAERHIFEQHKANIAEAMGDTPFDLVDLGSGHGHKTHVLLEAFVQRGLNFRYVPIDISEAAVAAQSQALRERFPALDVRGIVGDFISSLHWHSQQDASESRRNFVLFLGSNIGNFSPDDARAFLRSVWHFLQPNDCMLIGFDLKKDIGRMVRAYNDAQGVTSAFNLNLLRRINRELGANFALEKFQYYATYDPACGAVQSYLVSLEQQTVAIAALHQKFEFQSYEAIHTESSHKFLPHEIEAMARETGFAVETHLYDDRRDFTDSIWRVVKG